MTSIPSHFFQIPFVTSFPVVLWFYEHDPIARIGEFFSIQINLINPILNAYSLHGVLPIR